MNTTQIPEVAELLDLMEGLASLRDRRQARMNLLQLVAASPATSLTTESSTTVNLSAAETSAEPSIKPENLGESGTASTEAPTLLSQRLLGVLTEAGRTHVALCSNCRGDLGGFVSWLVTHVPDVPGTSSTSPKLESSQSADLEAEVSSSAAASPSNERTEVEQLRAQFEEARVELGRAYADEARLQAQIQRIEVELQTANAVVHEWKERALAAEAHLPATPQAIGEAFAAARAAETVESLDVVEADDVVAVPTEAIEAETCGCSDEHWRNTPRFDASRSNEAHEVSCPKYLKGGHFFPLPPSGSGDGTGAAVTITCIWCGEEKEQRPFELEPLRSGVSAHEQELKARRDALAWPTEHSNEEIAEAMKAKRCVDCQTKTTGMGARCQPCSGKQRAAIRKAEPLAAVTE